MKTEVRALEHAVAALLSNLEILLITEIGLTLSEIGRGFQDGFRLETPDHLSSVTDAFVTIHPKGWPKESSIHARFLRSGSKWVLHEAGDILADHLPVQIGRMRFKPIDDGLGVRLCPCGEWQREYVRQAYTQLIEALTRQLEALEA